MTLGPAICHAFATTGSVALSIWSPPQLFGDPADFCSAVRASDPVTAPFLQQNDLTIWAIQSLSRGYQTLDPFLGLDRIFIFGFVQHLPLILLAIQALVNGLTSDAIESFAEGALEAVDVVAHEAPAVAVRSFAMERVLGSRLNLLQRLLLVLLKYRRSHQRLDFSFEQFHFAAVFVVFVWASDLGRIAVLDSPAQTLFAKGVEAFAQNHAVPRFDVQEADQTLERLRVGNDVQVVQFLVVQQHSLTALSLFGWFFSDSRRGFGL